MENITADIVVIGSGPSGQKAAIQAAKLGKKVVVVEKDQEPGEHAFTQAPSLRKLSGRRSLI